MRRVDDRGGQVRVLFDERRHEAIEESEHVRADEHLPVAGGSGADADRRDAEPGCDGRGEIGRDRFEHQGERAGFFKGESVGDEHLGVMRIRRAFAVATELVHRLRCQAQVSQHGNADVHEPRDHVDDRAAALDLHRRGPAFLEQTAGIANRLCDTDLVGEKRHVGDDEGVPGSAAHGRGVVHHGVERDGERRLVPQHHHPERVADEQRVHPRTIEQGRHRRVVGGQHRDLLAAPLLRR